MADSRYTIDDVRAAFVKGAMWFAKSDPVAARLIDGPVPWWFEAAAENHCPDIGPGAAASPSGTASGERRVSLRAPASESQRNGEDDR